MVADGAWAQPLSSGELSALSRFERENGLAGIPRGARPQEAQRVGEAYAAARLAFAGQGARVADHFLRHTEASPAGQAFFFVLEAIADVETVGVLTRGLVQTPDAESGPEFTSGGRRQRLPRYEGEILVALEAALVDASVAQDLRVVAALERAIAALRAKPHGTGRGTATQVVKLLGDCGGDAAREALRRFEADPDAELRAAALGALGAGGGEADGALLMRSVVEDPNPATRIEAARAITSLELHQAAPVLRRALQSEQQPHVVDAIVQALARLNALPEDPATCLRAAARCWDGPPAALVLGCWRTTATRDAMIEQAVHGSFVVRAQAMAALVEDRRAREPTLLRFPMRVAPPPPPTPPGAAPIAMAPWPAPRPPPPSPPVLEDATRRRLLASAVEVLSRPALASPTKPNAVSQTVAAEVNGLLFDLAGADMRLALEYADRIVTRDARTRNDGRMAASRALALRDASGYEAQRRPRQAALAAVLAGLAGLILLAPRARRAAAGAVAPLLAWAVWSLHASGVRELPPLSLSPMTVGGSASLVAAMTAASAGLLRDRGHARGWLGALLVGGGAIGVAASAALVACAAPRWSDVFPVGGEGWEMIFEPIGAAIVAAVLCAVGLAAGVIVNRLARPS